MGIKYYKLLAVLVLGCSFGLQAQSPSKSTKKVDAAADRPQFQVAGTTGRQGRPIPGEQSSGASSKMMILESFQPAEVWKLESVAVQDAGRIVENSVQVHDELNKEFPVGKTRLMYDSRGAFRFEMGQGSAYQGKESRDGNNISWIMLDPNCPSCSKTLELQLLEQTTGKMTIRMLGEDEGSDTHYVFMFTKSNP